jgi:hypothetical protein
MKAMMLVGGLLGFLIGMGFALAQESEWPSALWRASIGAYLAGLLMRWWGRVWVNSIRQMQTEKMAEAVPVKGGGNPNKN